MIIETIMDRARTTRARIAVGAASGHEEKVVESAAKAVALGCAEVVIVSSRPLDTRFENIVGNEPEHKLIELLKAGKVSGVVRGTLDINPILSALREQFGVRKILRLALLKTPSGNPFFFAPAGIDDGWTVREKVRFGEYGAELIRRLGFREDIGVLGGGRSDDRGRSRITDKSIEDAEKVTEALKRKGYRAECRYILIEEAVKNNNFIIAPDGISGNLIYRSLCLVGGGSGMGGPVIGTDFVYVDTSRASSRYENAICLASALASFLPRPRKGVR